MATYQDLLDAIAHVRARTGDVDAWMSGLSGADLAVVASPVAASTPGLIDPVLAKIRAGHPELFDPRAAAPVTPAVRAPLPPDQQGAAAEAIKGAEVALAQQNSATAQLDLQVITAVLNAHSTDTAARAALDGLQRDIEAAVAGRTDLDTPAGARGFQRYLVGKLRDIRTVVDTAGLDATSKATLAAALASLYAASSPTSTGQTPTESPPEAQPLGFDQLPVDTGDDPLLDELLGADSGADPGVRPAAPAPVPAIPAMPAAPFPGGAGPGMGAPLGGGSWTPPAAPGAALPTFPAGAEPDRFGDAAVEPDRRPFADDTATEQPDDEAEDAPERPDDQQTAVHLPDGETVIAASPELAAVITAAVAGTPISEAFAQQGITIPAPGSPVTDPVEPDRLVAGDIAIFTDRHALALGNGKAVFNDQIQPIPSVTGPGFLGWEHPPGPGTTTASITSDAPTPTRPAVTAGPS